MNTTLLPTMIISTCLVFMVLTPTHAKKTFEAHNAALDTVAQKTGIEKTDVQSFFSKLVTLALGVSGLVFLAFMIYAGFKWMTARGNEEDITKARNTIIASIIGIALLVGAFAITNFINEQLINRATGEFQSK